MIIALLNRASLKPMSSGDLVKKNLTQSYFWLLLVDVDAYNRTAAPAYDVTSGISDSVLPFKCGYAASSLREKIKAEETLSKQLVQAAQDAEFPLRSFARLCTFDPFLRLAVIDPPSLVGFDQTPIRYVPAIHLTSHQQADLHCTKSDACHRSPRSRNIGSTQ